MNKFNHTRIVAALAVAFATTAASAATAPAPVQLYGGGATLPANAYVGNTWLQYNPGHRLSDTQPNSLTFLNPNPASADSLFSLQVLDKKAPAFVQYCQSGSGTGRGVIIGSKNGTAACGDYAGGTPNGFSALNADADFAGSDAPLATSEISTFVTNKGAAHTYPVQFPAVAGAIGIVYNNADQTSQMNLTESQICQIFAGQITDWNQLNASLPSKAIKVIVRSDSSGTSFSFMNHLSAVCPTAQPTSVSGFATATTFVGGAVGGVLPADTTGASGNGGVVVAILATDGAIGYAEVSDAAARRTLAGGSGLAWATVSKRPDIAAGVDPVTGAKIKAQKFKKFDPILNLPKSVAVNPTANEVLGANDANGRPTLVFAPGFDATTGAPVSPEATAATGCVQVVDPNSYATAPLKKGDYTQYPIIAVSYLMSYFSGNDATKLTALENLMASPYKIPGKVKTIGKGTGFAGLSVKAYNPAGQTHTVAGAKFSDHVRGCLN